MRHVKLMADYDCYPLWEDSPGEVGNIDPASLPLSTGLQRRLLAWADAYDATLDRDDPRQSGFASAGDKDRFVDEGLALYKLLLGELGSAYPLTLQISAGVRVLHA